MTSLGFAWRSLTREPARSVLGAVGVGVVGALLLDMLMLSRGLLVSFQDLLAGTGYDVRVTAAETLPGLGPPIPDASRAVAAIARLPEVADVVAVRFEVASVLARDGRALEVTIVGTGPRREADWRVLRGRDLSPGGAVPEVVVNESIVRQLGVGPGGTLALRPGRPGPDSAAPPTAFRIVGVAEFPFEIAGERLAAVPIPALRAAGIGADRDEADLLLVASRPGTPSELTAAAIQRVTPALHPASTAELVDRFRRTDFSYFRQVALVLSTVTSFFAFLLVATLLTVSVNQRLGEVAALRALGFSRRRVAADLLAEAALLMVAGALVAVPVGLVLAGLLDHILRGIPGLPTRLHFFVIEPRALVLHALLLAAAGLLAALGPVIRAVRLPPAPTLRQEVS
jgi:putative ABC transport system permease protein